MSSALAWAFRGWRQVGDWYAKSWADAAENAITSTQSPTATLDEKADVSAKLWGKTLAGWGLIANEFLDSAAILSEYPDTILRQKVKFKGLWGNGLQNGTSYTPVLQGDLVSLMGDVVPKDCCYFDPAVVVDMTQGLEIVIDRRSKKSFLYEGVVEFHDPAGSLAGSVDISVGL